MAAVYPTQDKTPTSPEQPTATHLRAVESRNPATGEVWKRYSSPSREEVFAAVRRARVAQRDWSAQPLALRVQALRRFHKSLYRRRIEVADVLTSENGKPAAEALANEVAIALDFARFYADRAPRFLRATWTGAAPLAMKRKRVRVVKGPYGVIGVISPWNYPWMLSAAIVLPALVTGNAVVLKPSEFTPTSGALLAELLHAAGIPEAACQVLQGDGDTGAALCDAAVDKIFFTGSDSSGRKVAMKCAERLIPCSLELGGSDAAIVLADADVRHAAHGIAWGRFSNAGQTCVAPKRVYVEAAAYEAFVAALAETIKTLRLGPGESVDTDVGPMISAEAVAVLAAQRDDALARGATMVASALPNGLDTARFFPPTMLLNVPPDARVLREETFGPLLPVLKVRDPDEAVALANASEYGLAASIWSADTARAALLAGRIEAGSVSINDVIVTAGMADVPHGGVKRSGMGRTHGMAGLEECVRTKAIVADRFPSWRQAWWFGYGVRHAAGINAFVRLAHGVRPLERMRAIPPFLKLLFSPGRPR
ncbi:MAG TPA: aldehyde dehydrogenase family protein [Gemmatimonadaceae bacterium]|nr:aldehyde dehydrogenase family protein [Gemmatimonadaceae bacterium]